MKKEDFGHIILFVALGVMVIAGGLLTYEQFQSDHAMVANGIESSPRTEVKPGVLDTLKFLTNNAFEYTEYCVEEGEKSCETLSKTVMSVSHGANKLKNDEAERLQKYPSKSSVNLTLKKYSVSRTGSETYYVTVESFDAFIEGDLNEKDFADFSTGLNEQELLRSIESCNTERLIKNNLRDSRPI